MNLPRITIVTDRFLPDWVAARTIGLVVLVRPKYKDDIPLLKHEYTHVKQWYKWTSLSFLLFLILGLALPSYTDIITEMSIMSMGVFAMMYISNKSFRLHAEAEAYAMQHKCGGNLDLMASRLAHPGYKLDIDVITAKEEIKKYL